MSSALVFEVAVLISVGAVLRTRTHVVGWVTDRPRFACVDATDGKLIAAPEHWDETTSDGRKDDRQGKGAVWVKRTRQDWSAFGAARAFVGACKEADVKRAIKRARAR